MKYYRKRYVLKNSNRMSILFSERGISRTIYFGGANPYSLVRGFYETEDPNEQAFLEAHPLFHKEFVLERSELIKEVEDAKAPVIEAPEMPQYTTMTFKTVKECQEYLQKELGLKGYLYSSYAKCKTVLKEHGIIAVFENEAN